MNQWYLWPILLLFNTSCYQSASYSSEDTNQDSDTSKFDCNPEFITLPFAVSNDTLRDIWAFSNDNIYISGVNSLRHFDGNSWSIIDYGESPIHSLWGSYSENLYIGYATWEEHVNVLDSDTIQEIPIPSTEDSLWGVSDVLLLAGQQNGLNKLSLFENNEWTEHSIPSNYYIKSMWGIAKNSLFLVDTTSVLHWNGVSFSEHFILPVKNSVSNVWGTGDDDIYTWGKSYSFHFDGNSWNPLKIISDTESIVGLHSNDDQKVYALLEVLNEGTILAKRGSSEWTRLWMYSPQDTYYKLHSLWAISEYEFYLVGGDVTEDVSDSKPLLIHLICSP